MSGESDLTRRTVQEEIVCDRCGIKETVEGFMEYGLTSKTMLSTLFPVWNYRKPEGWIAVGDGIHPSVGTRASEAVYIRTREEGIRMGKNLVR